MIIGYILYLRNEKKLVCGSIKVNLAAILHFFQVNNDDFSLTIKNFRLHLPPDDSTNNEDRYYTTGSKKSRYYTFCTLECYNAIQEYLEYRKRCGEDITKDKSPLIREQFNIDDSIRIHSPRFVSDKGMEYLINQVLKRSGVRKPGEVHMSHGFRKFFMTTCEQSRMKSINVEMLLGHDIGVSGHYYRPAENDILEDYMTHAAVFHRGITWHWARRATRSYDWSLELAIFICVC